MYAQRLLDRGAGSRSQGASAPALSSVGGAQAASEAPSHSSGVSVGERPGSPSGGPPAWEGSPPHARPESGALHRRSGLPDGVPTVYASMPSPCITCLLAVPLQHRDGAPPCTPCTAALGSQSFPGNWAIAPSFLPGCTCPWGTIQVWQESAKPVIPTVLLLPPDERAACAGWVAGEHAGSDSDAPRGFGPVPRRCRTGGRPPELDPGAAYLAPGRPAFAAVQYEDGAGRAVRAGAAADAGAGTASAAYDRWPGAAGQPGQARCMECGQPCAPRSPAGAGGRCGGCALRGESRRAPALMAARCALTDRAVLGGDVHSRLRADHEAACAAGCLCGGARA